MASQASLQVSEPDENAPSSDNGPSVHLHLYKPSGEFCVCCIVSTSMMICSFIQLLETGKVTPDLNLRKPKTRAPWRNSAAGIERVHDYYVYKLVWADKVLMDWWTFMDLHGMSENEANDIYVIKQENVSTGKCLELPSRGRTKKA